MYYRLSAHMNHLLIYTFWISRGIIAQTLFEFKDQYKIIYTSGDRGLKTLESQILKLKPTYILGLGYYRRGVEHIRSEQVFKNKYGRQMVNEKGRDFYFSNWKLEIEGIKDGLNAGTSNCNKYGYTTLQILEEQKMRDTKFAYLHVPPDFSKETFTFLLKSIIEQIQ